MFNLGLMYEKRRGISPDVPMEELLVAAKDCYSAAAAAGVHKAAVNLGVLYLTGRLPASGPEEERQNQVEAFRCFKLAADAGDVSAMYNLALCYEKGIGAEKDYAAAEALKQAAARHEAIRQGQALQEISVAALQQSGLPVMKDVSGADPESAEESRPPRPSGPLPDQVGGPLNTETTAARRQTNFPLVCLLLCR
jgi:TPR repeat protein